MTTDMKSNEWHSNARNIIKSITEPTFRIIMPHRVRFCGVSSSTPKILHWKLNSPRFETKA